VKAGLLDQSRARTLVKELESICKRNDWPVAALVIMGADKKNSAAMIRLKPENHNHQAAILEYPLVGNALMAAGISYLNDKNKGLLEGGPL